MNYTGAFPTNTLPREISGTQYTRHLGDRLGGVDTYGSTRFASNNVRFNPNSNLNSGSSFTGLKFFDDEKPSHTDASNELLIEIKDLQDKLEFKDNLIKNHESDISNLKETLNDRESEILEFHKKFHQIMQVDSSNSKLSEEKNTLKETIQRLTDLLTARDEQMDSLVDENLNMASKLEEFTLALRKLTIHCADLKSKLKDLEENPFIIQEKLMKLQLKQSPNGNYSASAASIQSQGEILTARDLNRNIHSDDAAADIFGDAWLSKLITSKKTKQDEERISNVIMTNSGPNTSVMSPNSRKRESKNRLMMAAPSEFYDRVLSGLKGTSTEDERWLDAFRNADRSAKQATQDFESREGRMNVVDRRSGIRNRSIKWNGEEDEERRSTKDTSSSESENYEAIGRQRRKSNARKDNNHNNNINHQVGFEIGTLWQQMLQQQNRLQAMEVKHAAEEAARRVAVEQQLIFSQQQQQQSIKTKSPTRDRNGSFENPVQLSTEISEAPFEESHFWESPNNKKTMIGGRMNVQPNIETAHNVIIIGPATNSPEVPQTIPKSEPLSSPRFGALKNEALQTFPTNSLSSPKAKRKNVKPIWRLPPELPVYDKKTNRTTPTPGPKKAPPKSKGVNAQVTVIGSEDRIQRGKKIGRGAPEAAHELFENWIRRD